MFHLLFLYCSIFHFSFLLFIFDFQFFQFLQLLFFMFPVNCMFRVSFLIFHFSRFGSLFSIIIFHFGFSLFVLQLSISSSVVIVRLKCCFAFHVPPCIFYFKHACYCSCFMSRVSWFVSLFFHVSLFMFVCHFRVSCFILLHCSLLFISCFMLHFAFLFFIDCYLSSFVFYVSPFIVHLCCLIFHFPCS